MHGVLTSDLLMKNIYCYVAKDGYAARVADTRSYDAVRWANLSVNPYDILTPSQQGHPVKMDVPTRSR